MVIELNKFLLFCKLDLVLFGIAHLIAMWYKSQRIHFRKKSHLFAIYMYNLSYVSHLLLPAVLYPVVSLDCIFATFQKLMS